MCNTLMRHIYTFTILFISDIMPSIMPQLNPPPPPLAGSEGERVRLESEVLWVLTQELPRGSCVNLACFNNSMCVHMHVKASYLFLFLLTVIAGRVVNAVICPNKACKAPRVECVCMIRSKMVNLVFILFYIFWFSCFLSIYMLSVSFVLCVCAWRPH